MEREQAKALLASRGWLALLPDDFRTAFLARTLLQKFPKGATLYASQDPPGGMYGLVSGTLAITTALGSTKPRFIHSAQPGFWVGEGSVITGEARRVGVIARTDVVTLYIPLSSLNEMIAADATVWRYLARHAIMNLDTALQAFDDMNVREPLIRIASILLRFAGYQTPHFDMDQPSMVEITQTELAEIARLSRNAVSDHLASLEELELIELGYGHIEVPNPRLLSSFVSSHHAQA